MTTHQISLSISPMRRSIARFAILRYSGTEFTIWSGGHRKWASWPELLSHTQADLFVNVSMPFHMLYSIM
jgi:hypothetical protein